MSQNTRRYGILAAFLLYKQSQGCSRRTIAAYRYDLERFQAFIRLNFRRNLKFKDLCHARISEFLEGDIGTATKARRVACLKSFSRWLYETKALKSDPLALLPTPKIQFKDPEYLTELEFKRLLKIIRDAQEAREIMPGRDYAMIALFLASGIRLSELSALTLNDLQLHSIRVKRKGGKVQEIPIGKHTHEALMVWLEYRKRLKSPFKEIFLSNRIRPMDPQTIRNIVAKWFERAGIQKKASPHVLRHTFATWQVSSGTPLHVVQDLLGHASIQSTEIYLHVTSEDRRAAINKMRF
jgi:integrase/recombinase XerC